MAIRALIYSINNNNIEFYKKSLQHINCEITVVNVFKNFETVLLNDSLQIIILDLELDNTDAISVVKEIKSHNLTAKPFIVICSDKADDYVQISALNSGADEFIELPINHLIFESKLKAILRRVGNGKVLTDKNGFFIDHEEYKIYLGNNSYQFPRLEFKLLNLLFSEPNKVFSKDEIAFVIWNNKDVSAKRTIDIHIRNIRRKLGNDVIKTYRGLGYSLKSSS